MSSGRKFLWVLNSGFGSGLYLPTPDLRWMALLSQFQFRLIFLPILPKPGAGRGTDRFEYKQNSNSCVFPSLFFFF